MSRPKGIRRLLAIATSAAILASTLTALTAVGVEHGSPASAAANAENFDPGNIISDATFFESTSMSAAEVQSFLNGKETGCTAANGQPCLKNYTTATTTKASDTYCNGYTAASSETAAAILTKVGASCGINPQVLIVLLQKEQGLVTAAAPTAAAYRSATGYGCPDTSACSSTYYGFFNQVWNAARQFQVYTTTSSQWAYQPGRTNNILYNPASSCGSKAVYIQNQATANLYIYTPYVPNAAALAAGYGTGNSCSSYGNRNFYLYFTDWFGSTGNFLGNAGFESGAADWSWSDQAINRAVVSSSSAHGGTHFLATNTTVKGRSISQDAARDGSVGETVTATVWARAASGTFAGRLAVWGLGGTTDGAAKSFSVGTTWTQITVPVTITHSGHTRNRFEVYLDSTNATLWIDDATMTVTAAPELQNKLKNPGFEDGFTAWSPGNGFINRVVYNNSTLARSGNSFLASNTTVSGRSVSQTVTTSPTSGSWWTFGAWVRSSSSTAFTGRIALWGLGGTSTASAASFSVGSTWTYVSTTLQIPSSAVTSLKGEIYLDSTSTTLWVDDATVSKNLLTASSFEGPSTSGWTHSATNFVVYASGTGGVPAQNGSYYAASNTSASGSSVSQDVSRKPVVGEEYTAQIWVRSADGSAYRGRLALWQLGGVLAAASTSFTANGTWQVVTTHLRITDAATTALRLELYEDQTTGTLDFDTAQLR